MSFELSTKYLIAIIIVIIVIAITLLIVFFLILPGLTGKTGLTKQQEFTRLCGEWKNHDCGPDYYNSNQDLKDLCGQLYPDQGNLMSERRCIAICENNCNPIVPVSQPL